MNCRLSHTGFPKYGYNTLVHLGPLPRLQLSLIWSFAFARVSFTSTEYVVIYC